ncbi:hypothetical protein AcW1_001439 [Taiwanofungus camphoratus]|nr:hypothetical protein AcW1_001439 [Antrodia cinnamomea]
MRAADASGEAGPACLQQGDHRVVRPRNRRLVEEDSHPRLTSAVHVMRYFELCVRHNTRRGTIARHEDAHIFREPVKRKLQVEDRKANAAVSVHICVQPSSIRPDLCKLPDKISTDGAIRGQFRALARKKSLW